MPGKPSDWCDYGQGPRVGEYKDTAQRHQNHPLSNQPAAGKVDSEDAAQHHNEQTNHSLRNEDGQHYSQSYYNPGMESGQKSSISVDRRVGMRSGKEEHDRIGHRIEKNADISTTTHSAGPKLYGEQSGGDDQK